MGKSTGAAPRRGKRRRSSRAGEPTGGRLIGRWRARPPDGLYSLADSLVYPRACLSRDGLTPYAMSVPTHSPAPASRPGLLRRLGAAGPFALMLTFCPPLGALVLLSTLTSFGPWLRDHGAVGMLFFFLVIGLLLGSRSCRPTRARFWRVGRLVLGGLAVGVGDAHRGIALGAHARDVGRARSRDGDHPGKAVAFRGAPSAPRRADRENGAGGDVAPRVADVAVCADELCLLGGPRAVGRLSFGTVVGLAPRTALAAYAAAGVEQLMFKQVGDRTTVIVGIAVTVVAFGIVGLLAKRTLRGLTAPPPKTGG